MEPGTVSEPKVFDSEEECRHFIEELNGLPSLAHLDLDPMCEQVGSRWIVSVKKQILKQPGSNDDLIFTSEIACLEYYQSLPDDLNPSILGSQESQNWVIYVIQQPQPPRVDPSFQGFAMDLSCRPRPRENSDYGLNNYEKRVLLEGDYELPFCEPDEKPSSDPCLFPKMRNGRSFIPGGPVHLDNRGNILRPFKSSRPKTEGDAAGAVRVCA